jgi:hypothetical protein
VSPSLGVRDEVRYEALLRELCPPDAAFPTAEEGSRPFVLMLLVLLPLVLLPLVLLSLLLPSLVLPSCPTDPDEAFFAAGACGGTSSQEEAGVADYDDEAWTQHQVAQGHGLVPGCTFESMLKTSAGFHRVLYIKGEKIFTHGAATIFDFESESDPNDSCQTFSLPELLKRIEKKKCHVLAPPSITGAKALEWLSQRLIPAVCPLAHVHKWLPEECLHIDFESGLMIVERHEQEEMAEALQRYAGLGFPTDTELVKVRIYGSVSRFFPCSALHLLGFLTFQERTEGQTFRSAPEDQQAPLKRGLSSVCSDEHQTTPSVSSRKRVRAEAEGCHIQ